MTNGWRGSSATPFRSRPRRLCHRSTARLQSLRVQASQEGLVPLKAWVKGALDHIVQVCLKQPDLEFAWVGDDAVDPLQQAQTLSISGRRGDQDEGGGAGGFGAGAGADVAAGLRRPINSGNTIRTTMRMAGSRRLTTQWSRDRSRRR